MLTMVTFQGRRGLGISFVRSSSMFALHVQVHSKDPVDYKLLLFLITSIGCVDFGTSIVHSMFVFLFCSQLVVMVALRNP